MPQWIVSFGLSILPSLTVGILMAFWNRGQKKRDEARAKNEKDSRKKESLQIALNVATAELAYAIAMAIKRGTPNGEVEVAVERYNKAMDKFREFERAQLYEID